MSDLYSQPYSEDAIKEQSKSWAELEAERAQREQKADEPTPAEQSEAAQEDQAEDEPEYVDSGDAEGVVEPLNQDEDLSDYVVTSRDFKEDNR